MTEGAEALRKAAHPGGAQAPSAMETEQRGRRLHGWRGGAEDDGAGEGRPREGRSDRWGVGRLWEGRMSIPRMTTQEQMAAVGGRRRGVAGSGREMKT